MRSRKSGAFDNRLWRAVGAQESGGSRLTERRAMQAFHLLYGKNYSRLAKRFRRKGNHLAPVIWEPQYRLSAGQRTRE